MPPLPSRPLAQSQTSRNVGSEGRPQGRRWRTRIRLTREGKVSVVILFGFLVSAVVNEINLLVLLFGLMAGPMLFGGLLAWLTLRRLEVSRTPPVTVVTGEPFSVEVSLTNAKAAAGAWSITVEDTLLGPPHPANLTGRYLPSVWFAYVAPRSEARASYRATLTARGRYRLGNLRIASRFPLGLIEAGRVVEQPADLLVLPVLGRLTRRWRAQFGVTEATTRGRRPRNAALGEESASLRDFRPGDSPRRIHWRTTARKGQLMVREVEQHRRRDFALVLDLWQPAEPSPRDRDLVELAVSFAATLCADACHAGGVRIRAIIRGTSVESVQGQASAPLLRQILAVLATAEVTSDASPQSVLDRTHAATGSVFVVSTRPAGSLPGAIARVEETARAANGARAPVWIDVGQPDFAEYYCWT